MNRITGHGLQIQYRFPRTPFREATDRVHVELILTNTMAERDIKAIQFSKAVRILRPSWCSSLPLSLVLKKPPLNVEEIDLLASGTSLVRSIGIDFNDTTQSASFELTFEGQSSPISVLIPCHVGELLEQNFLTEQLFEQNLGKNQRKRSMHS